MPIRRLLRRLKNTRNNQPYSTNWGDLHAEIDAQFQLIGAAVIGSWEVLLTDSARSFRSQHAQELPADLYQRLSDAIVPLQQCVQHQSKSLQHVVTQAAQQKGVSPLVLGSSMTPFPLALEESWLKSCEYLQPSFQSHQLDRVLRQWMDAAAIFKAAAQTHSQQAFEHPFDRLEQGREALVNWREALVKTLEMELYARRAELCQALRD